MRERKRTPMNTLAFEKISAPLGVPVATSRGNFSQRESLLVKLTRGNGESACGECAPWHGFGCETLASAETFLRENENFAGTKISPPPENLPCLAHAISAAEFFAENPRERGQTPPPHCARAKLVRRAKEDSVEKILAEIARERAAGFSVFKIKVGLSAPGDELAFCEKILRDVPAGIKIRFDANGAFPPEILPRLEKISQAENLEFFEQVFPPNPENDSRIFALDFAAQKKFALDESVRDPAAFPRECGVVAVVKPLLAGDFRRLLAWLENPAGADVVVSTVFENTEAGRDALFVACSRVAKNRSRAVGLG